LPSESAQNAADAIDNNKDRITTRENEYMVYT